MKKFICSALLLISLFTLHAQTQPVKIGYINSLELLSQMPEARAADSTLSKVADDMQKIYNGYLIEYQRLQDTIDRSKGIASQAQMEAWMEDLNRLGTRIQQFQDDSQKKLDDKKSELYKPILEKATNAVKEVAKENGYTYVFDSSAGAIVQAPDEDNMIDLVKKKLNLK